MFPLGGRSLNRAGAAGVGEVYEAVAVRMDGQEISREEALSRKGHKHACHILLYGDTSAKLFHRVPVKHIVLGKDTKSYLRDFSCQSDRQRRRMVRTVIVNPQTSSKDLQHHLPADGVTVHRSTIQHTLHKERSLSVHTPQTESLEMQMRFDGLLGFPGGLVNPSQESLESGLSRELQEEVGIAVPVTVDDYVYSRLAPSPPNLITHFYTKKMTEADLIELEKAAVGNAADHGLEVMGMVRVPLYTLRNGGGLPWFLSHSFISNSRAQLLRSLRRLGLVSEGALDDALRQADQMRHTHKDHPR